MKLNWGTGLAAAFILFIAAVLIVVSIALSTRVDLVTDRYYDRGVSYQERIDALERTAARQGKLLVRNERGSVVIEFPRHVSTGVSGSVFLYRPADRSRDVSHPIAPDSGGTQRIDTRSMDRGLWRVQVSWREGVEEYYAEHSIMLY
jgi:nitrogen fixation protein FixH